jgi:hypothetical protein
MYVYYNTDKESNHVLGEEQVLLLIFLYIMCSVSQYCECFKNNTLGVATISSEPQFEKCYGVLHGRA